MESAAREDVDFSSRNAIFMEMQGTVAAMLLGYKLPEYRRLGCGSKLLNLSHDLAAEFGCELTSNEVCERNETAVRLYRRHGFEIVDRRPVASHSSQPYDGDIVMLTRVTKVCWKAPF